MRQPDPIPDLKRKVATSLVARLEGWNRAMAAELLRTDQPHVSDLRNAKLGRFSFEQLIRFAARYRATVSIEISRPRR
jgi:predicted XRE-type DNA-binding protein